MPDALQVLREDHNKVKDMFQRFEKSENRSEKKQIADQALMELEVHAQIEEEIFYPSLKKQLGDVDLLHEAEEEHHVAELLMDELKTMRLNDKSFDAKFMVLAENVKHHIGEEEGELFPKAAEAGRSTLDRVGQQLMDRKTELMEEMQRPRRRTAASGSRNGRSRAGRTARTTARSRSGGTSRSASKSRASSTSRTRATAGSRSRSGTSRGATKPAPASARSGGSRARSSSGTSRSTTKRSARSTGSRSRR